MIGFDAETLPLPLGESLPKLLRRIERRLVERALDQAFENCTQAAKLLKINRTSLVEKRRKFGMSMGPSHNQGEKGFRKVKR